MVRLSVVVPAFRVADYLPACLESVLGEAFDDFELIVVDDASPDECGAIIDDCAARDAHVRAVHLPENVGLGRARNAGLDATHGDYVLFLDGDDLLAFGALPAIAARLAETGDPDLLVYDYVDYRAGGELTPHRRAGLLRSVGPEVTTLDESPQLLRLAEVAWNKAYRREFLVAHGLRFPVGYYEDLPVTYPVMLTARRIVVLDRVCVHYRERESAPPAVGGQEGTPAAAPATSTASILAGRSERHVELLDQYERVFAFLDAHRELERWRSTVFTAMLHHGWTVFGHPGRLPGTARREFLDRLSMAYRRYVPPDGFRPTRRADRLRAALTRDRAYRSFVALLFGWRMAARVVRRVRKLAAVELLRRGLLLGYYAVQLGRPRDPALAVYAAYRYRTYAGNPAAICEKARELAPNIHGVWLVRPGGLSSIPAGVDAETLWTRGYFRAMARASWFVTDTTVTRRVVKRRGAVWVQTHHGTPLKRMGLDLQEHPVGGAGLDFAAIPRLARRWDYVVSANAYSTEIWQRAYPGSGEVLDVGYPRNDRLATATPAGVARARSAVGVGNRTTVLYLPTFRDRRGDVGAPGPDPAAVAAAIPDEALLLVRAHYRAERRPAAIEWDDSRGHARIVDVSSYQPLEELYLAADILVTDYSSAMFDYAVLDRPMVIYAPDWEAYRADRGVYFDLLAHPPGVVARNDAELVDAFRSGAVWAEQARRKRATFRARFCALDDGHAAERVTRRVFLAPQARTDRYPRSRSPRSA